MIIKTKILKDKKHILEKIGEDRTHP